ncbi:MAG: flagellar hook-basal body complex protein FliE [Syntrophomonadaceae bacterium]
MEDRRQKKLKPDLVESNLVLGLRPEYSKINTNGTDTANGNSGTDFISYLNDALLNVNKLQHEAADSASKLALGNEDYLHNTMISYEKATLALQLTIEVRNKIIEAYQEIMRIQM